MVDAEVRLNPKPRIWYFVQVINNWLLRQKLLPLGYGVRFKWELFCKAIADAAMITKIGNMIKAIIFVKAYPYGVSKVQRFAILRSGLSKEESKCLCFHTNSLTCRSIL